MTRPIQDVIPPERKSIRHIPMPVRGDNRKGRRPEYDSAPEEERRTRRRGLFSRLSYAQISLWFIAAVAVLVLVFSISILFTSATVAIEPKQLRIPIDLPIVAKKMAGAVDLPFEVITISEEGTETLIATGERYAEQKASGKIVIYNNFSSAPQRLIKNTRFETASGLIYRINQSITIPGRGSDGNSLVPGSIEAVAFADETGPRYNIGLTDFNIPGFKNDPGRFKGFYARSKTPMTGGFTGTEKIVAPENLKTAREKLRVTLGGKLTELTRAKLPDTFWFPESAVFATFESLPQVEVPGGKVKIRERASSTAVIFNKERLSVYLAKSAVPEYQGEELIISNLDTLTVEFKDKTKINPLEAATIIFSIKGEPQFVWLYDAEALRNALSGKPKKEMEGIFKNFPGIERTEVIVRPFWKSSFPNKSGRIKIETHLLQTKVVQ